MPHIRGLMTGPGFEASILMSTIAYAVGNTANMATSAIINFAFMSGTNFTNLVDLILFNYSKARFVFTDKP